jgi:hypothetical protein
MIKSAYMRSSKYARADIDLLAHMDTPPTIHSSIITISQGRTDGNHQHTQV